MPRLAAPALCAAALCLLAGPASADSEDLSGSYTLSGRQGFWGRRAKWKVDGTLELERRPDGAYAVTRRFRYRSDGHPGGTYVGVGRLDGSRLEVTFEDVRGLSGGLTGASAAEDLEGRYRVEDDGVLDGWSYAYDRRGRRKKFYEDAEPGAAPIDAPTSPVSDDGPELPPASGAVGLRSPVAGATYLAGQLVPVVRHPEGAEVEVVAGEAALTSAGLRLDAAGPVTLRVRDGEDAVDVAFEVVPLEVRAVTVLDALPIEDAAAPHFRRGPADGEDAWEPAAILKDRPLRLRVTLGAAADPRTPATIRLVGRSDGEVVARGDVSVTRPSAGAEVTVAGPDALTDAVAVNALEVEWSAGGVAIGRTPLRVYTVLAPARDNPLPRYSSEPPGRRVATELHLELACGWADGATANVADGSDSVPYQLDNRVRHHVAWEDYGDDGEHAPVIPHYPEGARSPRNYDDLRGSVSRGQRSVSPLYYPPLEPDEDYERYRNYRNNFGWWVLDNPRYTGGRCNQQASLICDVFGTVGIEAHVYYIERWGRGKRSGRGMRRFYKSSRSSKSWNFHGVVRATLGDGSRWIYDGSGSWPPRRINGSEEELFKVPEGTFVDHWNPWKYDDTRRPVPEDDRPTRYVGQSGAVGPGDWRGVPIQPGEEE